MTKAVDFIKLLSERDELQWLYDDVVSTIRQGLVEEANSQDPDKFELTSDSVKTKAEQKRLLSYDKTRAFTEKEVCDLILNRLKSVYLEIPKFQQTSFRLFQDIQPGLEQIMIVDSEEHELKQLGIFRETEKLFWGEDVSYDDREQAFQSFIEKVEEIYGK